MSTKQDSLIKTDCPVFMFRKCELFGAVILITNKTVEKNPRIIHICKIMLDFLYSF